MIGELAPIMSQEQRVIITVVADGEAEVRRLRPDTCLLIIRSTIAQTGGSTVRSHAVEKVMNTRCIFDYMVSASSPLLQRMHAGCLATCSMLVA